MNQKPQQKENSKRVKKTRIKSIYLLINRKFNQRKEEKRRNQYVVLFPVTKNISEDRKSVV